MLETRQAAEELTISELQGETEEEIHFLERIVDTGLNLESQETT